MVVPPPVKHAQLVFEHEVKHQNPDQAKNKLEAATISREAAAMELQGVFVASDTTVLDAGPPPVVRRTICLDLYQDFIDLYPNDHLQEGALKPMFFGALDSQSCADMHLASFTLSEGGCRV